MERGILERDPELARLAGAAREAAGGAGSVVLVFGEAGIGKSSLVRAMPQVLPAGARMLVGQCDDLATGRPLGPFRDLIGSVGPELTKVLAENGDRQRVYDALRTELTWTPHPAVLVVEDVHWADDATLDTLRFLIRRMPGLPALLVLTYRHDELGREHPLRALLGLASHAEQVHRLPLARLTEEAVRRLSAGSGLEPAKLYAVTSGNPFFVTEVLAAGDAGGVPPTVVDAVLARLRGLDGGVRDTLEQLAVVPGQVPRPLVDALVPGGMPALAPAEQRGLLVVSPDRVAFRHELIRRAVADSLPAARRIALNREVLAALQARSGADLSQLVHHAAEAGDLNAVARYGPDAAAAAARAGSHREAAAHLRLVLAQRGRYGPRVLALLLERFAVECYTVGFSEEAVSAQRDAVELRRGLGETRTLGAGLRWLSRIHWWAGDIPAAERSAREAIAVLEPTGDVRLLAHALSNQSQLHMLAYRNSEAIALGERAVALARQAGDPAILSHALNNTGCARWRSGGPDTGRPMLEESLRVALDAGEVEDACRAYVNIVWSLLEDLRPREAGRYLAAAMELADHAEHLGFLGYMHGEQAMCAFAAAEWDEAGKAAGLSVLDSGPARIPALTVLGRIRARRGDPDADELLARAWELAVRTGELQRTGPVAAARAEAAWLRGDHAAIRSAAETVYGEAVELSAAVVTAELGYWLTRPSPGGWAAQSVMGVPPARAEQRACGRAGDEAHEPPHPRPAATHPYALQTAGRWREAAAAWREAGYPYEHAAALAESPSPADKLTALAALDTLGAAPLARMLREELRALGVPRVPRGPQPATRQNPAGLTERQLEVIRLLARGLTNPEIAQRLVVSVRTVDNHVAAALEKLGARTRRQAASRAAELGVLPEG